MPATLEGLPRRSRVTLDMGRKCWIVEEPRGWFFWGYKEAYELRAPASFDVEVLVREVEDRIKARHP